MIIIQFKTTEVEYNEAIDGGIVQVTFDEDPNQGPFDRKKCYVKISQNYEFPGKSTVEWHDGVKDDGGAEVQSYVITNNNFELITNTGMIFKIQHEGAKKILKKIKEFLRREFD